MNTYNIGDWVDFDYMDMAGLVKHWVGEIVEIAAWGYRMRTGDGFRSFRFHRMKNIRELV